MKKIIIALMTIILFVGCTDLSNTPTKKTEAFLKKYQTLDNSVLTDLNEVLEESTMTDEQKDNYRDIMKKHYQNLSYEIKDEKLDGDSAIVTVEISVTDFKKVIDEASIYLSEHQEEFNDDTGNYSIIKFTDYRLSKLKEAKDKVKYTIDLSLSKVNDEWEMDRISQTTYDKINGIYDY